MAERERRAAGADGRVDASGRQIGYPAAADPHDITVAGAAEQAGPERGPDVGGILVGRTVTIGSSGDSAQPAGSNSR